MNVITLEHRTDKPLIYIPPYSGLGSFAIMYAHKVTQPVKKVIKVILTVELHLLEEFTGNKGFKIMEMVSKYRVNVKDKLEAKDLCKIWHECAKNLVEVFNTFERKQFGKESPIAYSNEQELLPKVAPVMDWYNSLP